MSKDSAQRSWTVLELLRWTTSHFAEKGIESARLDAELLLAHALGSDRLRLYVDFDKPVQPSERVEFRELVKRRAGDRVPVSQLLGSREFWSLEFKVTADVLTPRPETETLVEAALGRLGDAKAVRSILDVGTGTGAIALALAHERPQAAVTATDISPAALQIARENADQLRVSERLRFLEGSLFEPVAGEQFDLIVSNPPYLARSSSQALPPELAHEPDVALFGGVDGYEVLRPFAAGVFEHMASGASVLVEIDPGQVDTIAEWFAEAGLVEVETLRDLAGRPRGVVARRL